MTRSICLVAAEASADVLAGEVVDALRAIDPDVRVSGIGFGELEKRGVDSLIDLSGLSVLGLVDGVRAFRRVKAKVSEAADAIIRQDPDHVVLIDSWGFMWRLAQELAIRGARARRIKLIGPQVWATRPGRARVLARWCEHLFCIHAFETPYYERWGLAASVIGNPAASRYAKGDGRRARLELGIPGEARVIGMLPGSRPSELKRVAPVFERACAALCRMGPDRLVLVVPAPPVEAAVREMASRWRFPHRIAATSLPAADAFSAMDIALACSGTVTTELAGQRVPMLVGYRLGWVTWAVARAFLMRSRYITLLNVAAGREIAPEFIQTRFTASRLVKTAERLLSDEAARRAQTEGQSAALALLRPSAEAPSHIVARALLTTIPVRDRAPVDAQPRSVRGT